MIWLLVAAVAPVIGTTAAAAADHCESPDSVNDPTCADPGDPTYCDPAYDPACEPAYNDPGPTSVPYCDPSVDATCEPDYSDPGYSDPSFSDPSYSDPTFSDPGPTTVPRTSEPVDQEWPALDSVITRTDSTDDLTVSQIPEGEVPFVTASRIVLGVDALAELGVFERLADPEVNELLREVREQVPADGLTAVGYQNEIGRLAEDLPKLIEQLERSGFVLSDEVQDLADELDDETVAAIRNGDTSLLDPDLWLSAVADLAVRGGDAPSDDEDPEDDIAAVLGIVSLFALDDDDTLQPALAEDSSPTTTSSSTSTTTAPTPTTETPEDGPPVALAATDATDTTDPSSGASSATIAIGGAIAGLLALVAFLLIRRRASADSAAATAVADAADHKLSVNDLLDASRRMTAALDVTEISEIALAETRRLVDAEDGLIALRTAGGLAPAHATPTQLFRIDALDTSSLRRVTETGQSISTVATDEPVLVEVPMAMAAVPIVADGTVTGAIMVVRVASNPFGREDLEALEMLAPLVGSAFTAAQAHGSATELADVEPMTGLKNRRRLDRDLASTGDALVAYIMLDVDHFKNFNDVNGHAAGDEALRRVASTLAASVRPGDVVYRYGGEEFCVLLPDTTAGEAFDVAERIRAGVEACAIPGEENQPSGTVTVSIGVADTSTKPVTDLVERADAALYEAKDSGRNQVMLDSAEG